MTLDALARELLGRHGQPGMVVAVRRGELVETAATGWANARYRIPMTVDTGFLTGSITKVWMTTLAMTFVEQGSLDLDAPVHRYLPWARLGTDESLQDRMTIRSLLTHSTGIDAGDLLLDTGPYPVGVEPYVQLLRDVGHLYEPGRFTSYNNAGWLVLELVLKSLGGMDFHSLLKERVLQPLGLGRTHLGAAEAILHPTAVGHLPRPGGGHDATPRFLLPECFAAAGTTLITTVEDTLRFLTNHLRRSGAPLQPGSYAAMQQPQCADPTGAASGFALGWRHSAGRVFHHGGGSYGGLAMAMIRPDDDLAYVAFVPSSDSMGLHLELQEAITGERSPSRVDVPAPGAETDLQPMLGTFERATQRITITGSPGDVRVRIEDVMSDADLSLYHSGLATELTAVLTSASALVSREPANQGVPFALSFLDRGQDGRFELLFTGGRVSRRVA